MDNSSALKCPICKAKNHSMIRRKDDIFLCWKCGSSLTEKQINEKWEEIEKG